MSYIVVYQREDGSSGVEECADLDLAIVSAERLRNVDSVERPRIFKTDEITYDFKPYYRVEVTSAAVSEAASEASDDGDVADGAASGSASSDQDGGLEVEVSEEDEDATVASDESDESDESDDLTMDDETIASEPPVVESPPAPPAPTGDLNGTPMNEPASVKKGLFGDGNGDSTDFPPPPSDDTDDVVPPRRGLFGR